MKPKGAGVGPKVAHEVASMSGVPEVDPKIRKLANAIFRSQGSVREYFTDLFPHFRDAVKQFNLDALWRDIYALVVTGDFEVDRVALFLERIYKEDPELFARFMGFVLEDLTKRFHAQPQELEWVVSELKEIGLAWNGSKLSAVGSS